MVELKGLLYLPHCLATTIMRLSIGKRPELPWLGYRAIKHLDRLLQPDWKMLEFGSGMSTIWFAKRCRTVASIEGDEQWYCKIQKMLKERRVTNVEYKLKNTAEYSGLDEYADRDFDFILIDGYERAECATSALSKIKEGGYIYLDNSDKCYGSGEGDVRLAEEILLSAARENMGQVEYFVDLIPTYVAVTQGMLVRL